jgi:hypothetical protein
MDKLEKQISNTKIQIDKYKGHGMTLDSQRKQMVDKLEVNIIFCMFILIEMNCLCFML